MESAEARLKKQVSDRLLALIGCPVDMVVQMVVRIARDSASAADLEARLVGLVGFPSSADTVAFAKDVYGMFPCKGAAGVSEYQKQVLKLLDGNDDEDNARAAIASSSSGNNNREKRFGRKGEEVDSDDDEATAIQDSEWRAWPRHGRAVDAGNDFGGEELELDRDQIEMVQLDRQIMEHGAANSRNEGDKLARRSSRYRFLQKHRNKKVNKKAAVALRNKILEYENIFYSIKVTDNEFDALELNSHNYPTWTMYIKIALASRGLVRAIQTPEDPLSAGAAPLRDEKKYAALYIIRNHIHSDLKSEYLEGGFPLTSFQALKTRYEQQKAVVLLEALHD